MLQEARKFLNEIDEASETLALYATLDEKNRVIQALKQRLMNQQLQLAYYLHKNLSNENILEFSSHCAPQLSEQNMQLSLAMYKFIKDNGGKSKLNILHEKLHEYDVRVTELLAKQEELVKNASEQGISGKDGPDNKSCSLSHYDIYTRIMNATVQVKKELEELRVCSEQIMNLEAERNALVDYVFSLPTDHRKKGLHFIERLNSGEIQQNNRSASFDTIENDQSKYCTPDQKYIDYQADRDSQQLEEQMIEELKRLKIENEKLNVLVETITESSNPLKIFELELKCEKIEKDLEDVRKGLESEVSSKDQEILRLSKELEKSAMQTVYFEDQISDLKSSIHTVVEENELLQSSLSELKEVNKGEGGLRHLQEILKCQKEQIRKLVTIICDLKDDKKVPSNETEDEIKLNLINMDDEPVDSGLPSSKTDYRNDTLEEDEEVNETNEQAKQNINEEPQFCDTRDNHASSVYSNRTKSLLDAKQDISYVNVQKMSRERTKITNTSNEDVLTTTSLHVESLDNDGKRECIKAILESSAHMEGCLEMDNSSKLRLRLHCNSFQDNNKKIAKSENTIGKDVPVTQSFLSIKQDTSEMVEEKYKNDTAPKQLDAIKLKMDNFKSSREKKNIVRNIKNVYEHLFGANESECEQNCF